MKTGLKVRRADERRWWFGWCWFSGVVEDSLDICRGGIGGWVWLVMACSDGCGLGEDCRVGEIGGCDRFIGIVGWSENGEPLVEVEATREVERVECWFSEVTGACAATGWWFEDQAELVTSSCVCVRLGAG